MIKMKPKPDPTDFDALVEEALQDPIVRAAYEENKRARKSRSRKSKVYHILVNELMEIVKSK